MNRPLSKENKRFNRVLSRQRIIVEHANRWHKVFKILSKSYRDRHHRFDLRCNLLSEICNFELELRASTNQAKLPKLFDF